MKKSLTVLMIIVLLIVGLFVLTGCENKNDKTLNVDNNENKINLKFDYEADKITYYAHFNKNEDDKLEGDEESNFVRIENDIENYILDLMLNEKSKNSYEQYKISDKENNQIYEEVKYGNYNGYYSSTSNNEIYGFIIVDDSNTDSYKYVAFNIYLLNQESENNDIQKIYSSSKIQNILNSIEVKVSELEVDVEE